MNIREVFKDDTGSGYIDAAVKLIVFAILLLVIIIVLPIFSMKMDLSGFADNAVKRIERYGCYDSSVESIIDGIAKQSGLDPAIRVDTTYISGTRNIQMNEEIMVTVEQEYHVELLFADFSITLRSRAIGMSEVFYK